MPETPPKVARHTPPKLTRPAIRNPASRTRTESQEQTPATPANTPRHSRPPSPRSTDDQNTALARGVHAAAIIDKWADQWNLLPISHDNAEDWATEISDNTKLLLEWIYHWIKDDDDDDDVDMAMDVEEAHPDRSEQGEEPRPQQYNAIAESLSNAVSTLTATNATLTAEIISLKKQTTPLDKTTEDLRNGNAKLRARVDELVSQNANILVKMGEERVGHILGHPAATSPILPRPAQHTNSASPDTYASRLTKSANPQPFRPTKKPNPFADPTPTGPADRHHHTRLIVELFPFVPLVDRMKPTALTHHLDKAIETQIGSETENGDRVRVKACKWNAAGNLIIFCDEHHTAHDLIPFRKALIDVARCGNEITHDRTHCDNPRFQIRVDNVPLADYTGRRFTTSNFVDMINEVKGFEKTPLADSPFILLNRERMATEDEASMVIPFANPEDAKAFLRLRQCFIGGQTCGITPFIERKQIKYCNLCHSLSHTTDRCQNGRRCAKCTDEGHTSENHPSDSPLKCMSCSK